jgi:periplasmic protein TonB
MDFDNWTNRTADKERQKRLMVGYSFGILAVGGFLTALSMTSQAKPVIEEPENILDVALAEEPEPEPEPEPEVEEPEPETAEPQPKPQGPVLPELTTPVDIPDDAPEEKEPDPSNPYASADPYKFGAGQRGTGPKTAKKVVEAAPAAPPPPKNSGPVRVTADTIAPVPLIAPATEYPASAKAAGIEGTVIVKFVVDVSGNPTQVQAVRGPEGLQAACEDKVKGSKFTPAQSKSTGQAVAVHRVQRCVFRLKT